MDILRDIDKESRLLEKASVRLANSVSRRGILPGKQRAEWLSGFRSADSDIFFGEGYIEGIIVFDEGQEGVFFEKSDRKPGRVSVKINGIGKIEGVAETYEYDPRLQFKNQIVATGLYRDGLSVFPVVAERPGGGIASSGMEDKEVLEERFRNCVMVVIPASKFTLEPGFKSTAATKEVVPSSDFKCVLVPKQMDRVAKAFESWGIKVIRVGYKKAKVFTGEPNGGKEYQVPDFESYLASPELNEAVIAHAVRFPTVEDVQKGRFE